MPTKPTVPDPLHAELVTTCTSMISVSPGDSMVSADEVNEKPNGPATFASTVAVELPMFWMLTCCDAGHAPEEALNLSGCGADITRLAPKIVASRSTIAVPAF